MLRVHHVGFRWSLEKGAGLHLEIETPMELGGLLNSLIIMTLLLWILFILALLVIVYILGNLLGVWVRYTTPVGGILRVLEIYRSVGRLVVVVFEF